MKVKFALKQAMKTSKRNRIIAVGNIYYNATNVMDEISSSNTISRPLRRDYFLHLNRDLVLHLKRDLVL